MNNIDQRLKEQLDYQQGLIINSTEKKVVVSAGPGSGKTYTIVQRISKELSNIKFNQGIIACSFTKEASKQLEERLEQKCDISNSYIGTIDSFVLMGIIDPYKNRLIKHWNGKNIVKKLKIRMAEMRSLASEITKYGTKYYDKVAYKNYLNKWKNDFLNGVYEISFANYLVAIYLIRNFPEVKEYLSNKFISIYIDEAQDLNEFQHMLIKVLADECQMNCFLIGDKNQSIYQFRGARPEQFYNLCNLGYTEYKINVSVRCHKSILEFANSIVDDKYVITGSDESRVNFNILPTSDELSSISGNFMILFETNQNASLWYQYLLKKGVDVIYSKPIDIADKDFKDEYLDLIEEILFFYYNFDNKNTKLTYRIDDFRIYLSNFILEEQIKNNILINFESNVIEYLIKILSMFDVSLPETIKIELSTQLCEYVHVNHYIKREDANRIMTIHSSKGLEAENVFVVFTQPPFKYDDEYKRKLFVAFSRAKNNLYISFSNTSGIHGTQFESILLKKASALLISG